MWKLGFKSGLLVLAVAGCSATGSYIDRSYAPITQFPSHTVHTPSTGTEMEVEPGKNMLLSARQYQVPAVRLEQDLKHQGKYSDVYASRIIVPAGLLMARGKDNDGTFYESGEPVLFAYHHIARNTDSEPEALKGGIYVPTDASKPAEVYWYWEGEETPSSSPHPGLPYKAVTVDRLGKDGFKHELVYSGVYQNTVSIQYREYKDDTGRPSLHQDLKYDLAQGNMIGYRGARFQILKADNTRLRYKVLQPLE